MKKKFILVLLGLAALLTSASVQADPLKSVAKQLASGTKTLSSKRIAVLVFPYENGDLSSGSTLISEHLTSLLAERSEVRVIERSRLASVLSEIKFEETGVTSSSGSAKTGEIENVDAVVTGTLSDISDEVTLVNARLINLKTGEILAAKSVKVDREWEDSPAPPPLENEDSGEEKPYVMNASPLIFTPSAHPVRSIPVLAETPEGPSSEVEEMHARIPSANTPAAIMVPQPVIQYAQWNVPSRSHRVNHDVLYAMALTLDAGGHHRQADRFYKTVAVNAPRSSPLRAQAVRHLSSRGDN